MGSIYILKNKETGLYVTNIDIHREPKCIVGEPMEQFSAITKDSIINNKNGLRELYCIDLNKYEFEEVKGVNP